MRGGDDAHVAWRAPRLRRRPGGPRRPASTRSSAGLERRAASRRSRRGARCRRWPRRRRPSAVAVGAGEGAAHVAEQLALEEVGRDGPAVDRHQRVGGAPALVVQRARHQVLAAPRLAVDEHRSRGVGHPQHQRAHLAHRSVLADDRLDGVAARERLAQRPGLVAQAGLGQRAVEEEDQLVHLERLRQVVVRALADRLDGRLHGAERGHDDDRAIGRRRAGAGQQREAVEPGHPQIGDQRGEVLADAPVRLARVADVHHLEAVVPQLVDERVAERGVVVDDEDATVPPACLPLSLHVAVTSPLAVAGTSSLARVPPPARGSRCSSPPW